MPPDEINIVKPSNFYGWPYCYGKNIWDRIFDSSNKAKQICETATPSYIDIPAHSAPLGLAFIPESWPAEYRNDLLVAYHGSWNRSVPTGYKIVRVKLGENGNFSGTEPEVNDFITGWLSGKDVLGRPVDLIFDSGGGLFISDDYKGAIYKVMPQ